MKKMKKLMMFVLLCIVLLAGCSNSQETASSDSDAKLKKLVIAEPVHSIGYLPLYAAVREGYFKEEGLEVEIITATGGAHVTSVISGDAWGNIGGPESNAMANVDSPDPVLSIVNVVNRANVYLMADKDLTIDGNPSNEAMAAFFKGKTIAAGRYGGSLNLLTRWLLMEVGLDPEKDVRLEEPADPTAVLALVEQGAAQIANGAEPQIKDGIDKGVWSEPFYSFTDLGDYPYSVISIKKSSIEEDPATVQSFVNAIIKGLDAINNDPVLAMKISKQEFPTTEEASVQAALDRGYADELWSKDGFISEESVAKTMDVVHKTGIFTKGYKYEDLIDMQFVEK